MCIYWIVLSQVQGPHTHTNSNTEFVRKFGIFQQRQPHVEGMIEFVPVRDLSVTLPISLV